jgi:hypothetical protein
MGNRQFIDSMWFLDEITKRMQDVQCGFDIASQLLSIAFGQPLGWFTPAFKAVFKSISAQRCCSRVEEAYPKFLNRLCLLLRDANRP